MYFQIKKFNPSNFKICEFSPYSNLNLTFSCDFDMYKLKERLDSYIL